MANSNKAGVTVEGLLHSLRAHWLSAIECDHDGHRDRPICGCSMVDLGWQPTVGDAIEAWVRHVEREAQADDQPWCVHQALSEKHRADKKYWRDRALRAEASHG